MSEIPHFIDLITSNFQVPSSESFSWGYMTSVRNSSLPQAIILEITVCIVTDDTYIVLTHIVSQLLCSNYFFLFFLWGGGGGHDLLYLYLVSGFI